MSLVRVVLLLLLVVDVSSIAMFIGFLSWRTYLWFIIPFPTSFFEESCVSLVYFLLFFSTIGFLLIFVLF